MLYGGLESVISQKCGDIVSKQLGEIGKVGKIFFPVSQKTWSTFRFQPSTNGKYTLSRQHKQSQEDTMKWIWGF